MPNAARGELNISLGGTEYVLRATVESILYAESETGIGWNTLLKRAWEGDLHFTDIAAIIWAGMRGADPANTPSLETVKQMIFDEGLVSVLPVVQTFVVVASTGTKSPEEGKKGGAG